MTYDTPQALRIALEARLRNESNETGIPLDRLRRRVIFQRIVTRLERAEPGRWVLKGGMAMEVRLGDAARLTKDVDFGLRDESFDPSEVRDRVIDALSRDDDRDGFVFAVGGAKQMAEDGGGHLTWRLPVGVELAARPFGGIKLDVSPRPHEVESTDRVPVPNALVFAGVETTQIEIVDVHRHAAEKLHAMLRSYGDGPSTRVRDLVDVVLLLDHELIEASALAPVVITVWRERDGNDPQSTFPGLPALWPEPYEAFAHEYDIEPPTFEAATDRVTALWNQMFSPEES